MYKLSSLLIIPLFLSFGLFTDNFQQADNNGIDHVKTMSFSSLSPEQKAEALAYFKATGSCEYKGIKLYGKVQFVSSYPDIKIQYVSSYPDIKVKFVTSYPDDCGEWQKVDSYPDFKVQVVTSYPDLKVQEVSSYPGMN